MVQLSENVLESIADFFKVLSEGSRLQILSALQKGPMTVTELVEETGLGQANLSKHLKLLTQAGILSRQPSGVSVYYEIVDPIIFELCELVCGSISKRLMEQAQQFDQFALVKKKSSQS
ncbi:ArsR/SmtB family transcription factor [Lyngbya confervoides]|uniref:Metalloregulator ArsR/SmtB family transcription factor n=1 Tax=Lyngbya confervoides BDU141951 TaxID=1574623 RepID=A0ABD4T1F4_9CYAN|nr:metalloregulator ArsR/SmtB family transcription factor [Lyngbya confervoides]MCM1982226.1 metalloregulator ArsR/SmtB family transcription factor [Lyngbya confervoides BDU141951]